MNWNCLNQLCHASPLQIYDLVSSLPSSTGVFRSSTDVKSFLSDVSWSWLCIPFLNLTASFTLCKLALQHSGCWHNAPHELSLLIVANHITNKPATFYQGNWNLTLPLLATELFQSTHEQEETPNSVWCSVGLYGLLLTRDVTNLPSNRSRDSRDSGTNLLNFTTVFHVDVW